MRRTALVLIPLFLLGPLGANVASSAEHGEGVHASYPETTETGVRSALSYLRDEAQNDDGSFGQRQQHLQTGLAILAILSTGEYAAPPLEPDSPLRRAAGWLLKRTGDDGFLGDDLHPTESHAVCALALTTLLGKLPMAENAAVRDRAKAALSYTLKIQDRGVGADYHGGWKADPKRDVNDRRATGWCLLQLYSMRLRGFEVSDSALTSGIRFMEASQKLPDEGSKFDPSDRGGFSHDAAGLPVSSVTGAGLATLNLFERDEKRRRLALQWLRRNRPVWYGPNFFYTHFFTARGMIREAGRTEGAAEQSRRYFDRVWRMLRDHQRGDGRFEVPPANAEYTQKMGGPYATAMGLLILNAPRRLLPIDGESALAP